LISKEAIRSLEMTALVDTGAMHLCLPSEAIARLGLRPIREVMVETANGPHRTRTFGGSIISLLGREATFDCIELPNSERALLGVIPLEALGIELDLQSQSLKLLPMDEHHSYLTVY
ncbi:MAG: aspartyl protease family protein, partial [Blastocatellia bacterium]